MNVLITLTTAGANTGPFDLSSDVDGYFPPFESGVLKSSLEAGYNTIAPPGTTIVRVKSTGLCENFINITLTTPTSDCDCYLISSIQDPLFPLLGTTFFYTDCSDNFLSVYLDPDQINYICSKVEPSYFPEDRGLVVLEPDNSNCGGCPSSSTTTSTTTCPTYYELAGCDPADYAFTTIVPTLGVGQRYVDPTLGPGNEVYYTYTGATSVTCVAPLPYNASIQATGFLNCPT
jgi:hypothetical protein